MTDGHLDIEDCTPGRTVEYWPAGANEGFPATIEFVTPKSRVYILYEAALPSHMPMKLPAYTTANRLRPPAAEVDAQIPRKSPGRCVRQHRAIRA